MYQGWCGDVRGADAVAVRDRREALNGGPEQSPERLRLCFAQLRILRGYVRHRTVVLAELLSASARR
jgi:hypothetical protein